MVAKWRIKQLWLAAWWCILAAGPLTAQQVPSGKEDTTIRLSPNLNKVSFDSFLQYIWENTGLNANYATAIRRNLEVITYRAENVPLHRMLDTVFSRLGLGYRILHGFLCLYREEQQIQPHNKVDTLQGRVTNVQGEPLGYVSVFNGEKQSYTITSSEGLFKLPWPAGSQRLVLSHIGYEAKILRVNRVDTVLHIRLRSSFSHQVEVVVIDYRPATERISAGAAFHLRAESLRQGPGSSNPIRELSGRVPGLLITETSGAPGALIKVQMRGQQSIGTAPGTGSQAPNSPLMVLNKIPLMTGNTSITQLPSAAGDPQAGGGISAQATINPADIETIDVLKEVDATAIYGARGAHGVILMTTRSGQQGRPAFRFNIETGFVASSYVPRLLDNREYTAMRKEALAAAGMKPTVADAPDLLLLDTNHYINLPELLAGGTGKLTNVHGALQGGDSLLQYYLSNSYYQESSVMPASLPHQRLTSHAHIRYRSPGSRVQAALSMYHSILDYTSIAADPMHSTRLVPLLPALRDVSGKLTWSHNGFSFINPLAQFSNRYHASINTLTASFQGEYRLGKNLLVRTTLGYQSLPVQETLIIPMEGRNTTGMPWSGIAVAHSRLRGFTAEPQLVYEHTKGHWVWGGLLGTTFQEERREWRESYQNENEPALQEEESQSTYRYKGVYGRWHTGWGKRYFLNATGRLDVSSRFGPGRNMAFFGALAGAWIFSKEHWTWAWPGLTLGKLRASYGTVGNDNVENEGTSTTPSGQSVNPSLSWERSRKLEMALELETSIGLSFSAAWYRNRTTDQFMAEKMPGQALPTGFRIVNWPAKVVNTGWEFTGQVTHRWSRNKRYTSSLVLTLPRNRLQTFPGIAATAYNNTLVVGQPLSVWQGYRFQGVDAETGLFIVPASPDTVITGYGEPRAYAGWSQELKLGRFGVSLLLEARWQTALNPLYEVYRESGPGNWLSSQLINQPRTVLQRWQRPGDQAAMQRFTAANTPDVQRATQFFLDSDAMILDASFWRIRSLFLSWYVPGSWWGSAKRGEMRIYLQGHNLFTVTAYRNGDPTIQYPQKLPSLRTITAGLQIGF